MASRRIAEGASDFNPPTSLHIIAEPDKRSIKIDGCQAIIAVFGYCGTAIAIFTETWFRRNLLIRTATFGGTANRGVVYL
jgi:hypothetical protein